MTAPASGLRAPGPPGETTDLLGSISRGPDALADAHRVATPSYSLFDERAPLAPPLDFFAGCARVVVPVAEAMAPGRHEYRPPIPSCGRLRPPQSQPFAPPVLNVRNVLRSAQENRLRDFFLLGRGATRPPPWARVRIFRRVTARPQRVHPPRSVGREGLTSRPASQLLPQANVAARPIPFALLPPSCEPAGFARLQRLWLTNHRVVCA